MTKTSKGKLSLIALVLMIFTSVYGFNNIPRAFFRMGYGAIPWYIIGGLFFFLPFAFMVTELGCAYREEKGGIYSWMEKSVGPTFAFVGTFMWFASYLIWMLNISSGILVPITNGLFGETRFPESLLIVTIFGITWMTITTFLASKGMNKIKVLTSIGGTAVLALNFVLLVGALIVLASNGFNAATPVTTEAFFNSPSPTFTPSLVSFVAFLVFAIFAYGGVEAVGGLVDETDNPQVTFPKGVISAALIITIGYSLMILAVGMFIDYSGLLAPGIENGTVHLGNASYYIMQNLGIEIGHAIGVNPELLGGIFARFMGISITFSITGAFFTLLYSPVKQLIEGTPEKLWPGKIGVLKDGMPVNAMWVQYGIVVFLIVLNFINNLIIGAEGADIFFEILTNMTNVAMTLPYLFVTFAYIKFKTNKEIKKDFEVFKNVNVAVGAAVVVMLVVGFANFFTIIEPVVMATPETMSTAIGTTTAMIFGPIIFGTIAILLMNRYKRMK